MTNIEWCRGDDGIEGKTWNPVTGCTKVSAGCKHCYAETVADRFWAKQYPPITPKRAPEDDFDVASVDGFAGIRDFDRPRRRRFTDVQCHEDRLDEPLHWRKPRRVFVNSMSDLFHEAVPSQFIGHVFAIMATAKKHTFQVLTKRPERMRDLLADGAVGPLKGWAEQISWELACKAGYRLRASSWQLTWPLQNVWLGVSAENQETADTRIPILLDTPAAVRFVSAEPLLGAIDLGLRKWDEPSAPWSSRWIRTCRPIGPDLPHLVAPVCDHVADAGVHRAHSNRLGALSVRTPGGLLGIKPGEFECLGTLDWVIVGGESGAGARPCDVAWIRSIVEQCKAAAVPVFVKQLGSFSTHAVEVGHFTGRDERPEAHRNQHKASKGGDPSEWPVDLCVREFPEVRQ